MVELLREVLPYSPAVFRPPNLDRAYTECYGFTIEDIYTFGLKLVRQRWRTIGFPVEEMPAGVFPFDPDKTEEELAVEQVKMMLGGILGPSDGSVPPSTDPELMRLYFEVTARVADPTAANGTPLVYQWNFTDAPPWHLVIDNGSTRAEPGLAVDPAVTIESSWADWLATTKPDAKPLRSCSAARSAPTAASASCPLAQGLRLPPRRSAGAGRPRGARPRSGRRGRSAAARFRGGR